MACTRATGTPRGPSRLSRATCSVLRASPSARQHSSVKNTSRRCQGTSPRAARASISARPPRPPGSATVALPAAAAAVRRSAASAAAASYPSTSVWYTSSCMAPHGSEGTLPGPAIPVALSVAGSDPSGGAGIQADLKTFQAFGVYGAAVITALTVQNTRGVRAVHPVVPDVVLAQIDAVDDDLPV